jgi:hypothetical protein
VRRAGNFLNKHPFDTQAREEYFVARRQYNRKIKQTKKAAHEKGISLLMNSIDKREMWSLLSDLRGGKKTNMPIDTSVLHDHFEKILYSPHKIPKEKLDLVEAKLDNFLNNPSVATPTPNNTTNPPRQPVSPSATISPGYVSEFLIKIGKTLKNGKSAFTDGVINEIIKYSLPDLAPTLAKFFNHIESCGIFPTEWKTSFLVPLHKKGPANIPDNYRGLAVGSNLGKFFTKLFQ